MIVCSKIVNLTHTLVTVQLGDGSRVILNTTNTVAGAIPRLIKTGEELLFSADEFRIPVVRNETPIVTGLPPKEPGTIFLVMPNLIPFCSHRIDVYAPDYGETAIRDGIGEVLAVTRFIGTART